LLAAVIGTAAEDGRRPGPLVVAEHLMDADNIGSVFRNARALGATAVLLDDRCVDPLYRKAVRTSMASVLDLPWTQAAMATILGALEQRSVQMIGLTPQAWRSGTPHVERRTLTAGCRTPSAPEHGRRVVKTLRDVLESVERSQPIALVVGNEGHGLSEATLARCTHLASIPMAPPADSINVATALAIALYELGTR
ncbi:MAG: RNA methyltransferase, partial [Acidobacteria bacterium]|nr:RNA methyltransferase [Acidobacteriota bacterium]